MTDRRTFVLVHGLFHGGWCWRHVRDALSGAGHRVFTPTLTGLGERAHLLGGSIGLETFIQDITAVLEAEELRDVILVGHSFGGIPVTGAADRAGERLRRLVYLDGLVLPGGRSAFDDLPPEVAAERAEAARRDSGGLSMRPFPAAAFGVTDPAQAAWVQRRLTPHPLRTYTDRLELAHPLGNGLPVSYLACTRPWYGPLAASRRRAREQPGWEWREIPTGHDAMITDPGLVVGELTALAARDRAGRP